MHAGQATEHLLTGYRLSSRWPGRGGFAEIFDEPRDGYPGGVSLPNVLGCHPSKLAVFGGRAQNFQGLASQIIHIEELRKQAIVTMLDDFPNRFRTGEMPIGIVDYTTYNMLTVMAPEIKGLWDFTMVPGS